MDLKKVDSPYKTKDILTALIELNQYFTYFCTFQKVDSPYTTKEHLIKTQTTLIKHTLNKS